MNPSSDWIYHESSMTDKLKKHSTHVTLDVMKHVWELTNSWDIQTLGLAFHQKVLHREILMWAENNPCWYARTILPQSTYEAKDAPFERLKTEALGDIIWTSPQFKRSNMKHYTITTDSPEYAWLTPLMHEQEKTLCVRLSTFMYDQQHPFYLTEILLPGLNRATDQTV